jgi:hypothetical protein
MYSVAGVIWNEIADVARDQMATARGIATFSMTDDERLAFLDLEAKALLRAGFTARTVLAFQTLAPLLHEGDAIRAYLAITGCHSLVAALPEVLDVREAVAIALRDDPALSAAELADLRWLLQTGRPDEEPPIL